MAACSQYEQSNQVGGATDSIADNVLSLSGLWHGEMLSKLCGIE